MRKLAFGTAVAMCLFAGSATAAVSIDLIWANSGTGTLTFAGGSPPTANTNGGCVATPGNGNNYDGYCLNIVVTSAEPFALASTTLGWSAGDSGIAAAAIPGKSFAPGAVGTFGAVTPNPQSAAECTLTNCDTAVGSFGGLSLTNIAAGTYTIGSISFNLTGAAIGTNNIQAFLRSGIDDALNATGASIPLTVSGATLIINAIPEPGTASLLGLGIVGLVLAGRRRNR